MALRDLREVQKFLHMKFPYRMLTSGNLWVDFFQEKYLKDRHFLEYVHRHSESRFWKSIMGSLLEVMENVQVMLRGGNSSFWFDRRLSSSPLAVTVSDIRNKHICIMDCWVDWAWNIDMLTSLVGETVTTEIIQTRIK